VGSVLLGARVVLAAVFATAAVAKLRDRQGTFRALIGFGVPDRALRAGVILLPLAELATAVALLPKPTAQWGGLAALVLLLGFTGGIVNAMIRGRAPDCNCFGQLHSEPVGWRTLLRNGALAVPAVLVTVDGPGPSIPAWVGDRSGAELAAVAGFAAAALLGLLAVRLRRERDSISQSLANARAELKTMPLGLPVGVAAPDFTLPSLQGGDVSLEELRARGSPVALLFVSPGCGPCTKVFSNASRWQRPLADDITLALVSTGTPEENQAAVGNGETRVLLQENHEVNEAYRVRSTPVAVMVNQEGRIASPAVPGTAIESLIRVTLRENAERLSPRRLAAARPSA
jgi:peroxiredoxin